MARPKKNAAKSTAKATKKAAKRGRPAKSATKRATKKAVKKESVTTKRGRPAKMIKVLIDDKYVGWMKASELTLKGEYLILTNVTARVLTGYDGDNEKYIHEFVDYKMVRTSSYRDVIVLNDDDDPIKALMRGWDVPVDSPSNDEDVDAEENEGEEEEADQADSTDLSSDEQFIDFNSEEEEEEEEGEHGL